MSVYQIIALLITVMVALGYLNYKFLRLETQIGILIGALVISIMVILLDYHDLTSIAPKINAIVTHLQFNTILMQGLLSVLLFAGALTINTEAIKRFKWEILTLASFSTTLSCFIIGFSFFYLTHFFGFALSLPLALLFGALISPTDPVAVMATFKSFKTGKGLKSLIAGESLFNDGVAIVLFLIFYDICFMHIKPTVMNIVSSFATLTIGGIAYGFGLGWLNYKLMKGIKETKIAIFITLATVTGGYAMAEVVHISGPLAMVVAALYIGHKFRVNHENSEVYKHLRSFWDVVNELFNAILFMLIGFELIIIKMNLMFFLLGLFAIVICLVARYISVSLPIAFFKLKKSYSKYIILILTWAGVRGAIPVALALNIPFHTPYRPLILTVTYSIVAFSMIVQGLSIKPLIKKSEGLN